MLSVILIPLTLHLLPVYSFTIGHRLGLTKSLLVLLLLGIAYLHSLYGSIIQDMDNTTANTRLQILGAESLALNVEIRNIEISIDKIEFENAQEKLWQKQSLYYVQNFNVLVGKSVIVGVWALALICLNVMYLDFFSINFSDYTFVPITFQSFMTFFQLLIVGFVRFFICYYMVEVFYNTIRIISSMVNFMSVRIKR